MVNGYKAFYKGKELELYSDTLYHAQLKAAEHFNVKRAKSYLVHTVLCELEGQTVVHTAVD